MLDSIKFIFHLRGKLSGYKTYIAALAGILAVTGNFLATDLVAFINGELSTIKLITESFPTVIAELSTFFGVGALRSGINNLTK